MQLSVENVQLFTCKYVSAISCKLRVKLNPLPYHVAIFSNLEIREQKEYHKLNPNPEIKLKQLPLYFHQNNLDLRSLIDFKCI